jgi:hypothetical protein
MPRYNIYVRQEDAAIWQAINDKPEWLHQNLQRTKRTEKARQERIKRPRKEEQIIKPKTKKHIKHTNERLCKHFAYPGLCPVKGCINQIG